MVVPPKQKSVQQPPDNGALRYDAGAGQDPTALTTQQLLRENFWLREVIEAQIFGLEGRISAGDKAVELLQAFADRTPTTMDVQHEVEALREVMMERFSGINTTFSQNDKALTAALQAQEKRTDATNDSNATANTKMEDSFTKQIDALGKARESDLNSLDDKINSVKERVTIIESRAGIVVDVRKDNRDNMSLVVGFLGLLVAIMATAIALGVALIKH